MPQQRVRIELDADTAFALDESLRRGLASSGLIQPADARSIRDKDLKLDLEPKTAATISQMLRDGLITAGAAHQANNASVAQAIGRLATGSAQTNG